MHNNEFKYGPVSTGLFIAYISVAPLLFVHFRDIFLLYVTFGLFLAFGLKPLLKATGLLKILEGLEVGLVSRVDSRQLKKRRQQIDRQVRDRKYRGVRYRDEKLPPNW